MAAEVGLGGEKERRRMPERSHPKVDRPKLGALALFLFPHRPLPSMDRRSGWDRRRSASGQGKHLQRHLQAVVVGVAAVLVAAGCGDGENDAVTTSPATRVPTYTPTPRAPAAHPKPEPRPTREPTGIQDAAYRDAKDLCSFFSPKEIAAEYGGDPNDISSVVRAFATASYRPGVQISAEKGCLEGLLK